MDGWVGTALISSDGNQCCERFCLQLHEASRYFTVHHNLFDRLRSDPKRRSYVCIDFFPLWCSVRPEPGGQRVLVVVGHGAAAGSGRHGCSGRGRCERRCVWPVFSCENC